MVTLPSQGTILLTSLPVEKEVKIIVYLENNVSFLLNVILNLNIVLCVHI